MTGKTAVLDIGTTPVSHTRPSKISIGTYVKRSPCANRRGQATTTPRSNAVTLLSDAPNVEGGTRGRRLARSPAHLPMSKKSWNVKKVPMGKATMATVNSTSVLTTERFCFADNLRRPGRRVESHRVGKGISRTAVLTTRPSSHNSRQNA